MKHNFLLTFFDGLIRMLFVMNSKYVIESFFWINDFNSAKNDHDFPERKPLFPLFFSKLLTVELLNDYYSFLQFSESKIKKTVANISLSKTFLAL